MIGFIIFAALLSIPTIIDVHHAGIADARYYLGKKEYDRLRKIIGPNLDNAGFSYILQGGYLVVSFQSYVQVGHDGIELKRSGEVIEDGDVKWVWLVVSDAPDVHIAASWSPMKVSSQERVLVIHIIEKEPGRDIVKTSNGELHIASLLKPVINAGVHLMLSPDDKSFYSSPEQDHSYKWKLVELAYKYHQLPYLQQGRRVSDTLERCKCGVFLNKDDKAQVEALEALTMKYLLKKEREVAHVLRTVEGLLIDRLNAAEINEVSMPQSIKRKRTGEEGDSSPKKKKGELTLFEQLREAVKEVEKNVNVGADLRKKRIEVVDQPGIHFEKEYGMILPASICAFKKLTEGIEAAGWYTDDVKRIMEEIDELYKKYPYLEKAKERIPVAVGEEALELYKKLINFLPAG